MKKTLELLQTGFESSSQTTGEFVEFCKVFTSEFKHEVKKYFNVKDWKISYGHFYVSGFFKLEDDRIFYFSTGDVRYNPNLPILIRSAKDFKDFTGGVNNSIKLAKDMFKDYQLPK